MIIVAGVASELRAYSAVDGSPIGEMIVKGAENEEILLAAPPHLTPQGLVILVTRGGQVRALGAGAAPAPDSPAPADADPQRRSSAVSTTSVPRPLRRIYLTGLACALAAAIVGIAFERARFGSNDAEAAARVQRSIDDEISAATSTLQEMADAVAREPALFDAAAVDAAGPGVRALLDRADQVIRGRPTGLFAVTAYRPSGAWPLAWSGPASDVPAELVAGPESFLVTPGALGLRLLYIKPVLHPADNRRVGVVVAERVDHAVARDSHRRIGRPLGDGAPRYQSASNRTIRRRHTRDRCSASPDGRPLLMAQITEQSIRDARAGVARSHLVGRSRTAGDHADRVDSPAPAASVDR